MHGRHSHQFFFSSIKKKCTIVWSVILLSMIFNMVITALDLTQQPQTKLIMNNYIYHVAGAFVEADFVKKDQGSTGDLISFSEDQ